MLHPKKHRFDFDTTDTGRHGDTGGPFTGQVDQVRWTLTDGDTGGDVFITLWSAGSTDSGEGYTFLAANTNMGADFAMVPRQPSHNRVGTQIDTGGHFEPVVGVMDRLRVKVRQGDTGRLAGTLYVVTR